MGVNILLVNIGINSMAKEATTTATATMANKHGDCGFISILMPLYNGVEFLEKSVDSVFSQTISPAIWQLVIGINGRHDTPILKTVEQIIANLRYKHKAGNGARFNVRILDYTTNPAIKGKSAALNAMVKDTNVEIAEGAPWNQWIALLDVDDIWLPDKLKTQIPFMFPAIIPPASASASALVQMSRRAIKRAAYDVVGSQCEYFGVRRGSPGIPTGDLMQYNFFLGNPVINSSAVIRRELAKWNSAHDGVEDYDLWLTLYKQRKRFYNCPEIMVMHRIHTSSAFNSKGNTGLVSGLLQQHRI
jgi:glycosyltransferase involved in cell wall biosynthesis